MVALVAFSSLYISCLPIFFFPQWEFHDMKFGFWTFVTLAFEADYFDFKDFMIILYADIV